MPRIYLDHNATTPLDSRVFEAMAPVLRDTFGNASSIHWYGQQARAALDGARAEVAALVGASPSEIVFTASGTEADNLALQGLARAGREPRRKVLYASVEHHAVINTARALAEDGWPVEAVRVEADGRVDLADLQSKVDEHTAVVAVMLANNETGVVQPLADVVRIARARGALVHCDAVQAAGKLPLDVRALDVDTLALSAHKIYGPKGAGALFVKRNTRMRAFLRGGAQERSRRAGTENVAGIVGFGRAAALAREEFGADAARVGLLRDRLEALLTDGCGARRNGGGVRVANTANLSFEGVEAESLLMALDLAGVAVSTGAACAAGAVEPSHVLRAMGLRPERVQGSLRFSLGRGTTADEVERAAAVVLEAVARQRAAPSRR
ncbi:MAG: cysteine desulfurase family protein [Vicinamibacteria bacterium]